jgi:hypothetical protein
VETLATRGFWVKPYRRQIIVILSIYLATILLLTFVPQIVWGIKYGSWRDWRIEFPFVFKSIATIGLFYFLVFNLPFMIPALMSEKKETAKLSYFFARCAAVLVGIVFSLSLAMTHRWA